VKNLPKELPKIATGSTQTVSTGEKITVYANSIIS
jgi:hypothetical protein